MIHTKTKPAAFRFARRSTGSLIGLVLAALAPAFSAVNASTASSAGTDRSPKVAIESTRCNFGVVFAGEQLNHVFLVRNVGTKTLELDNKSLTGLAQPASPQDLVRQASFHSATHGGRPTFAPAAAPGAAPT